LIDFGLLVLEKKIFKNVQVSLKEGDIPFLRGDIVPSLHG
jgi:hypothetical protein